MISTRTKRFEYRLKSLDLNEINQILSQIGPRLDQVDAIGQNPDFKRRKLVNVAIAEKHLDAVSLGENGRIPRSQSSFTFPASVTDDSIARFNGTDGASLQDSQVTIDDSGNLMVIAAAAYYHGGNKLLWTLAQTNGDNIVLGKGAAAAILTSAYQNIFIGEDSGAALTSGLGNVLIGDSVAKLCTSSIIGNVVIGNYAASQIAGGDYNIALGYSALKGPSPAGSTTTDFNIAIGAESLFLIDGGTHNVAIGFQAGYYEDESDKNVFIGGYSGKGKYTGDGNVAVGHSTMEKATLACEYNIAIGYGALLCATSAENVSYNIAIGYSALASANGAAYNVCIGYQSGLGITSGDYNILIGRSAGDSIVVGDRNVIVGDNRGSAITSSKNTIVGAANSGDALSTGELNVYLGYSAGEQETASNKLYIANSNTTAPLIWGDFATEELLFNTLKMGFFKKATVTQPAHIADASVAHAITEPADSPASADALRDDIVTNTIASVEGALNDLGGKINSLIAALEGLGLAASA